MAGHGIAAARAGAHGLGDALSKRLVGRGNGLVTLSKCLDLGRQFSGAALKLPDRALIGDRLKTAIKQLGHRAGQSHPASGSVSVSGLLDGVGNSCVDRLGHGASELYQSSLRDARYLYQRLERQQIGQALASDHRGGRARRHALTSTFGGLSASGSRGEVGGDRAVRKSADGDHPLTRLPDQRVAANPVRTIYQTRASRIQSAMA